MKSSDEVTGELEELKEDFECLDSQIEKMQHIIDLAREFSNDDDSKQKEFQIQGCVSDAFIESRKNSQSQEITIHYFADALIIQGFLALIKSVLDNSSYQDLDTNVNLIENFSKQVGLEQFLSPNRANALHNILTKLKSY